MPKKARELSALQVRRLTRPGLHPVGGVAGLCLDVKDTGARSWILRATVGRRRPEIGLGGFPDVTLEQAREKAREIRELIRQGEDPVQARRSARDALRAANAKRVTFRKAAEKFLESKRLEFRNEKHAAQWASTLETYTYPVIGSLPVDQVEFGHVKKILDTIWMEKTETATRLRGRIESVLAYATASGYRKGDNPARWRGNLDAVMPNPGKIKKKKPRPALPYDELPGFLVALRARDRIADRALEFLILTALRPGEVVGATWDEINLKAKTWTVPGERMKAKKEHVVPLSDPAVELLTKLPRMKGSNYVFPAARGDSLSDGTLPKIVKLMHAADTKAGGKGYLDPKQGEVAVPHGFRSTFRDWTAERTSYSREVCEMALAHAIENKVEAAYRRGDLLEKRRRLMREWAKFCEQTAKRADVVPIRSAK